jgi:putative aminopeptidase FrvX
VHSPIEPISLKDVENASKLIAEWICTLRGDMSFIP